MKRELTRGYYSLRRQVEETLLLGRKEIEWAKVRTYWRTGKIIQRHIVQNSARGEHYGKQIVERLAKDLHIGATLLWRCVQFSQAFEILAGRRESSPHTLTWTHFRQLMTVPDKETRLVLMRRAVKGEWTADELAQKIQREIRDDFDAGTPRPFRLFPKRGSLYTYRLMAPDSAHKKEDADRLWIDLGFQIHRQVPTAAKGFRNGLLIESVRKEKKYSVQPTKRTESDLFTYKAFVERVVDGDTMIVKVDLGFETRTRQYLRLRGIDAPEIDTPEGKKAKRFVAKELEETDHVILTTTRSDKYGRYLADIFYGPKDETYLNQKLIDEGLAGRYE